MNRSNFPIVTGILFCVGALALIAAATNGTVGFAGLCFLVGSALFLYSAVRNSLDESV